MTDQVANIVAGYFEEILHIPVVQKLYYVKSSGYKSDIDLLGVKDKPILVEEKSTQPFVKFDDITTTKLHSIQSKLKNVLEKWSSKEELQKGWKKHFKAEVKEFFPQKGYVIDALLMCFDKFHNPPDVETGQAEAIRNYVLNYRYPDSIKWFVTADEYPPNLKEFFKTCFKSSCGRKTCLVDKLININDILRDAKEKIRDDILHKIGAKTRNRKRIKAGYSYNSIAMELLRQQVISELLDKEG